MALSKLSFSKTTMSTSIPSEYIIPEIFVKGKNSFQLGFEMGKEMKRSIHQRLKKEKILISNLLPFCETETGSKILQTMNESNKKQYPKYYEELQGIAEGSETPFLHLFVLNLRKEIASFLPEATPGEAAMAADQCSDLLLCNEEMAMVGHNEDADSSVEGNSYLVTVEFENNFSFTAFTYAGEMPSCAFGFNKNGIAFSLNAVTPLSSEVNVNGIARNFVSRDLLEASSMEDALTRITSPNLCFGHNYNIMDFRSSEIITVEISSNHRRSILPISSMPYFHANSYARLNMKQKINESSIHRMKRAEELLKNFQHNKEHILQILGDTEDQKFPIYMSGNVYEKKGSCIVTLCTSLFDLCKKEILIFTQNPKLGNVVKTYQLTA